MDAPVTSRTQNSTQLSPSGNVTQSSVLHIHNPCHARAADVEFSVNMRGEFRVGNFSCFYSITFTSFHPWEKFNRASTHKFIKFFTFCNVACIKYHSRLEFFIFIFSNILPLTTFPLKQKIPPSNWLHLLICIRWKFAIFEISTGWLVDGMSNVFYTFFFCWTN